MTVTVGTKVQKKQPESLKTDIEFEQALMTLEDVCQRVLASGFSADRDDTEALTLQHRFKNIVTPVSLALAEYKGPRRFHYHYRHREEDESILHPVLEPAPVDLLAQVCDHALDESQRKLVGINDRALDAARRALEQSLRGFLASYDEYKANLRD